MDLKLTSRAAKALQDAAVLARTHEHIQFEPVHLAAVLLGSSQDESGQESPSLFRLAVEKANGDVRTLSREIQRALVRLPTQNPAPPDVNPSKSLANLLSAAADLSKSQKDSYVAVDHLIEVLAKERTLQAAFTAALVPKPQLIIDALRQLRGSARIDSQTADGEGEDESLKKFTIDMTQQARDGKIDPVIGREDEIRRVIRILSRRTKNNPVLIGEPGVGKTTIAEGLALRIVNNDVPDSLKNCKLLSLDVGALVAGTKFRGEFEERMKSVLKAIEDSDQMIVLFVDEIHLLMGAGSSGEGGMDAANLLKPMLARGKLHCIGATTLDEYRKYIEKDQAFERRFQQVIVKEPSVPDTISILRGLKERYETHHGVTITDRAIVASASLAARYLTQRRLPDSAVDLIDEAAAAVRVTRESQPEELDSLERRHRQLQIEIRALEREKDKTSAARLEDARREEASVLDELRPMQAKYQEEKSRGSDLQKAKSRLDELQVKLQEAIRTGNYDSASDLQYGAIPEMKDKIRKLEKAKLDAAQSLDPNTASGNMIADAVGEEQIAEIVARWTGIPVTRLRTSEKDKLLKMEANLSKVVIGQNEAVNAVSNAIRLQRSGLANPNQPPSFLFCGPSGTGKTLLTKALAEFLFDDPRAMIRFDMSEYQERHSLSRMIGAPPGYVGHDAGGQLTEALRRRPFSILLFDEVEKAAKEVLTVLLQLMDDGRITDGQGRIVDAKNCIVVMTSNLGAHYLAGPAGQDGRIEPAVREQVMGALRSYFLPEFLNRISSIVIFNRLTKKEIRSIVDVRLKEIQKRLEKNGRNVNIVMKDEVRDYLGAQGYSPDYGARPLARLIEREILNKLAVLLLNESILDGEEARVVLLNGKVQVLPNHGGDVNMDVDDDDGVLVDDADLYD